MHYGNGREAKNGDAVVLMPGGSAPPVVGVLSNAQPGNDCCNGSIAPLAAVTTWCPDLRNCLRLDDALDALRNAPKVDAQKATP